MSGATSTTLTFEARGVLAFAQECGQPLTVKLLIERGLSDYKARKLIRELSAAGLVKATRERQAHGRMGAVVYAVIGSRHMEENHHEEEIHHMVKSDHMVTSEDVVSNARTRKRMPARVNLVLKSLKTNTKSIAPDGAARAEKPEKPLRNDWYDVVFEVWGYAGALNGAMGKMLQGTATAAAFKAGNVTVPLTPDDVRQWAKWYRANHLRGDPDMNMLEDRLKIASSIENWFQSAKQRDSGQDDFLRRLLGPNTVLVGVPGYDPALGPVAS
jgi:hypothetical protein